MNFQRLYDTDLTAIYATFEKRYQPVTESGCWIWTGSCNNYRYGMVSLGGKPRLAHRVMYELSNKKMIPKGMCICHKCDTPECVNPAHLFLGTQRENFFDMKAKGRHRWGFGESAGLSKLTDADVLKIRSFDRSISNRCAARMFSVSHSLISDIRTGKGWRHLLNEKDTTP